jgi:hypothetical protein
VAHLGGPNAESRMGRFVSSAARPEISALVTEAMQRADVPGFALAIVNAERVPERALERVRRVLRRTLGSFAFSWMF